jgi:mono/diheme cytochrome c family protein
MRKSKSMPATSSKSLLLRKLLLGIVLAAVCIAAVFAYYENRPWKVPEEAKQLKNPIPSSSQVLAAARAIYNDKCANCHGESGKGDGPDAASYYPSPTNLTDARHASNVTDGEIFYQISQGRKPMPAFKRKLTEEQRWQLVLFVRSLAAPTSGKP